MVEMHHPFATSLLLHKFNWVRFIMAREWLRKDGDAGPAN
jgi:hypothetical protein